MAWYCNHYHCGDCGTDWEEEWSCCCDDECPVCGSGDWSPVESEDLSEIVVCRGSEYVVMRSLSDADDKPRYIPLAAFADLVDAERFKISGELI